MKLTILQSGNLERSLRYFTDESYGFEIDNRGMAITPTENPIPGADYIFRSRKFYLKITGIDMYDDQG